MPVLNLGLIAGVPVVAVAVDVTLTKLWGLWPSRTAVDEDDEAKAVAQDRAQFKSVAALLRAVESTALPTQEDMLAVLIS